MSGSWRGQVPCRFFQTPAGCRRGDTCQFRHVITPDDPQKSSPQRTGQADQLREWIYLIPKDCSARSLSLRLPKFFQQGLFLLRQDAASRQEVITKLATDGGLLRIDEAITAIKVSKNFSETRCVTLFEGLVIPLLEIFSNEHVLSSPLLEAPMDTIFNFLFGTNGSRTLPLFEFCAKSIVNLMDDETKTDHVPTCLEAILTTLSKIVDLNGQAMVLEELSPTVEKLSVALAKLPEIASYGFARHRAETFLKRIKNRLDAGKDLPEFEPANTISRSQPVFKLSRGPPGFLSSLGARHDNDFHEVKDIKLMPTGLEIQSLRPEYLPTTDPFASHVRGVEGVMDRQFRLLREDTVGSIRDAIRFELERKRGGQNTTAKSQQQILRTFVYRNAILDQLQFNKYRGLDLIYEFDQPPELEGKTRAERKKWWEGSRRLQLGCFVCVLDANHNPFFCSVIHTGLVPEESNTLKAQEITKDINVYDHAAKAYVVLTLIDTDQKIVDLLLQGYIPTGGRLTEDILEFPGLLLASFQPTLEALQQRSNMNDLPFANLLAPSAPPDATSVEIPPPAYAILPGFRFDLSCLTGGESLYLDPRVPFDVSKLQKLSTLDDAQAVALVDSLRRSLACIQGPPGTGKSFTGIALIKTLLANKDAAKLGPIICVCYTNHALDQLLEHLVDHGVEQIIRIGSRSKSEVLQKLVLRKVAMQMEETKAEKQHMHRSRKEVEQHTTALNSFLREFDQAGSPDSIFAHVRGHYPGYAAALFNDDSDEDDWAVVGNRSYGPLRYWLTGGTSRSRQQTSNTGDRPLSILLETSPYRLTHSERVTVYTRWVEEVRQEVRSRIESALPYYIDAKAELHKARQEVDLRCLQQANVIGVTTSGLAKITSLLNRLNSKVVVCEEAGEVLEAHLLTALLPTVEHAILIGDHQQLRPQIHNYDLQSDNPRGKQYSLDMSLFERLVQPLHESGLPKLPFNILETQRRMHPSISRLIRCTLYPDLKDGVKEYPEVSGMARRLFWFDHNEPEAAPEGDVLLSTSHTNDFEVEMVTALVSHLTRQGTYSSDEIAVLTPYLGQLRKLRHALGRTFAVVVGDRDVADLEEQGIDPGEFTQPNHQQAARTTLLKTLRVATVDNFQGEEAKVVVISLVRSNQQGKVGFLRSSNRINVLLSRAMHGMYVVGNSSVAATIPMWGDVVKMLEEEGNIGQTLELCCPRHPDKPINVKSVDDFNRFAPEGGCDQKCDKRLACGHSCVNMCHSDHLHQAVKCLEDCPRAVPGCDTHPCPRSCGERCTEVCYINITNVTLPCGHVQDLPCYQAQKPELVECKALIEWAMKPCEHSIQIACADRNKPADELICNAPCNQELVCGHACNRACGDCYRRRSDTSSEESHQICTQVCGIAHQTCKHSCKYPCHGTESCPPCGEPCETKCKHSTCRKKCYEACTPCAEPDCASCCPHQACEMPCGVPCNWIPCSKRCEELLDCGHRCPSICGEDCPTSAYCQICCSDKLKDTPVDFILGDCYKEVDCNEDPCVFPACGHVITMTNLDGHFGMANYYSMDEDGTVLAVSSESLTFTAQADMKRCPSCRASLSNIRRYGRIAKRAHLDESTRRLEAWAFKAFSDLTELVLAAEELLTTPLEHCPIPKPLKLTGRRTKQFEALSRQRAFTGTFKDQFKLRRNLSEFARTVSKEEQPYRRVADMIDNIRKRRGTITDHVPNEVYTVKLVNEARANSLLLRLDLALLSKAISLKRNELVRRPLANADELVVDFSANRRDCEELIEHSKAAMSPAQQVEGHMLFARYTALESTVAAKPARALESEPADENSIHSHQEKDHLRAEALSHLDQAETLCRKYKLATEGLMNQVEQTRTMVNDRFYEAVSNEERLVVLKAMARELGSSGRWYVCANGHPFTVGECGRPMEQTACPECGAPVGGRDHQAAQGVQLAEGLERELTALEL